MHASLSDKSLKPLIFIAYLASATSYASDSGITITKAEFTVTDGNYAVSADIDFQLSEKATEAVKNGVPLFWTYQFKLKEQRDYIWNETLAEKSFRYRIQYHALVNLYRVRNETTGSVNNFSSLESALELMSSVRDFALVEKNKVAQGGSYVGEMKIAFDRDALPLPLRPAAYVNPQWYLSSDWFSWPLKN